jgi:GTP cyclohydrolase II
MKQNIEISQIATLPTRNGTFKIQAFKDGTQENLAIFTDPLPEIPMVRVHSECVTGDVFGSQKCDCGSQLDATMKMIAKNGGMLIYHRQEGRNIGLVNKVNAYALQDQGYNTVEANEHLGFRPDERTYDAIEFILNHFNLKKIKLITNNPSKIANIKGAQIVERIPMITEPTECNKGYLDVKKEKMGHMI